jgi:hypothetical protein
LKNGADEHQSCYPTERDALPVLSNIDKEKLARKIKETQPLWNSEYIENEFADECINCWDESLSECVNAWINNKKIPETEFGPAEYTISEILEIRENDNILQTFELLSEYINSPSDASETEMLKIQECLSKETIDSLPEATVIPE